MIKKCKNCKKEFRTYPSRIGNFCSRSCANVKKPGTFKKGHIWVGKIKTKKRTMQHGYIEIYSPNHPMKNRRNAVLEHRLVMEKKIGRYLKKGEVVHHKNGIKNDNRISNLELFGSHSNHIKEEYRTNKSFRLSAKKNQFRSS